MMDDETRRLVERDLADIVPFTQIASRHGVGYVDVALIHNRMRPQPPGWPEQLPAALWEEVAAALREDDLARIAAGDADPLLRTVHELDTEERAMKVRGAIGVLLDWHAAALALDEAVERLQPLGIPYLADAVRLAAADPPRALFLFAPAPFPDLLEAYEAARRRRDLDYVCVVEAGHSVHVSTYSGSGAWSSRTYRI